MITEAISIQNLRFSWSAGSLLLDIPSLKIQKGESVFLQGPSGCGKSTLLNLIGGVLQPDAGSIGVLGQDLALLNSTQKDRFRADHMGIIFQMFNLLPYLSVLDNVLLSCRFSQQRLAKAEEKHGSAKSAAIQILKHLELGDDSFLAAPVTQLSIGQQQRVAVARALIGSPEILIADEPTSALDSENRKRFLDLLLNECKESQISVLFVSHDLSLQNSFETVQSLHQLNHAAQNGVNA